MDYDKLIERLRKEAYGSDIEDLLLGASTAIETLWADLARVTAERDAAQALLAERSGVTGSTPITTAFGVPLDRLKELVEADKTLKEFAEDVARQFGYHGTTADGRPAYTCGGLSTLEWAWNILDWPDPKPAPECECQEEGCHEWATGGSPTPDGYKWLCGRHFAAYEAREEAEAALRREQDG